MTESDEFLLILMRLHLGIVNEDLGDRFCVSPALCTRTLKTWVRLLHKFLGQDLVVWIPRKAIRQKLPKVFRKGSHSNRRVTLDCAEVFIE